MTYEKKYFNIPLNFLRFIKEDGIFDKIISWGIVDFSKRQEIDVGNLAKQIMYWYYRKPNKIPESISDGIYEMIENDIIEVDQDYDGFYETEFDPFLIEPQQKDSVIDYINENELFKITCIEFYRIEQAVSLFGISPSNKIKDDYNKLNGILCEYEELYGKDTKAGIDIDLLFDARDGKIDKNVKIITNVHPLQIIKEEFPMMPYDLIVDIIITPEKIIFTKNKYKKPQKIFWEFLDDNKINTIPILQKIKESKYKSKHLVSRDK